MSKSSVALKGRIVRKGNGFDDLIRDIEVNAGHAAQRWAQTTKREAQRLAPMRTGHLKQSITATRMGPRSWQVEVKAFYGLYVEYGTRYMQAQPFLRPASKIAYKEFRDNVGKVFKA